MPGAANKSPRPRHLVSSQQAGQAGFVPSSGDKRTRSAHLSDCGRTSLFVRVESQWHRTETQASSRVVRSLCVPVTLSHAPPLHTTTPRPRYRAPPNPEGSGPSCLPVSVGLTCRFRARPALEGLIIVSRGRRRVVIFFQPNSDSTNLLELIKSIRSAKEEGAFTENSFFHFQTLFTLENREDRRRKCAKGIPNLISSYALEKV